ncbi:Phosphatase dcr2 [Rhodosporidiobolus nylandii]
MLSPSSSRTYIRVLFLVLVVLLSSLLTSRYKLAAPYDRPYGSPVNLGHQAFEVAFAKAGSQAGATAGTELSTAEGAQHEEEYWDEDDEYLDEWGFASTPAKWDPLVQNQTPLTEIQVKTCILSPGLYDMCSPTSTAKEDATRGKWQRMDKDVSKKIGIQYLYVYYRRLLPGSDAPVITDIRLLNHTPSASDLGGGDGTWVEVSTSLREGVWPRLPPLFLHYKISPQADVRAARKMDANGSAGQLEPITELDVLYGGEEVKALPGFEKVDRLITGGEDDPKRVGNGYGKEKGTRVGASLAYRKAKYDLPPRPVLRFSSSGNFTILQVADLHFSVGPGECRDVDPQHEEECKRVGADVYSLRWLETALDEVKPDLVVLSGDQLNGQETSWDAQSTVLKWAPLLYERRVPWASIFGNHDEQDTDLDHARQMNLFTHLPYYVGEAGPSTVDGTGNYVRSIRAPHETNEDTVLFNLYFLDSHAMEKKSLNPWKKPGYDWIKPSQINWFRGRSAQMHPFQRPYTPSASSSSNRRPSRPRPAAVSASYNTRLDRFRRSAESAKRQDDDETWADAAQAEIEEIEAELAAELEDSGLSTAVEPDDGSRIVNDPQDDVSFDADEDGEASSASTTSEQQPGEGNVETGEELDPLLEAELEAEAEEGWLEPTVLPVGPTKAHPMLAKPNAITFFHIPLPQAYTSQIDVSPGGKRLRVGERLEGSGASKTDSGFFEQAVLASGELPAERGEGGPVDEFWDGEATSPTTGRPEVKVLAHGHCHITSDCRRVRGVWICFGGGATYSGYGNSTFSRRMRVYQLSEYGEKIETYQLTDDKQRINRAMEFNVSAPVSGRVKRVVVAQGDSLAQGDLVVEIVHA